MMSCIFVLVVATSLTTLAAEKNQTEDGSINATSKFFSNFLFFKKLLFSFFLAGCIFMGHDVNLKKQLLKKSYYLWKTDINHSCLNFTHYFLNSHILKCVFCSLSSIEQWAPIKIRIMQPTGRLQWRWRHLLRCRRGTVSLQARLSGYGYKPLLQR